MDEKTITFIGLAITFVLGAVNLGITFWNSWRGQGKDKAGETDINAKNVKTIFDLQKEFVAYKTDTDRRFMVYKTDTDNRIEELEHTIDVLEKKQHLWELWAERLVGQLKAHNIVPAPFPTEEEEIG